ncbi:Glu-tRNA(Gln) amidotransferase subunit GatE [bacterium]|nr:Glu-tRNA(Gln) amidotransferase subunit GatE [bacterium]
MSQLPEYGTLSADDYSALGLKAGLEVHVQLSTRRKLFCRCPAGRYSDAFDAEILRHMRPTLSELGEYDGTALMEFKTRKEILYRLNKESVCTYEMDDAPPFEIDQEALGIAMEITLLLGLQPVGELHVMRKQYLDGSIPTGFQRTAILGVQGELPVDGVPLAILQLSIEEDSSRELSDQGHLRCYRTDRLGMPLVEVVTAPALHTPAAVEAAAQAVRRLTRATGKVRRGAGAARQDVNVSVRGGTRIEIKGVSRIPAIGRLVHNEALRQKSLLEIREILAGRGLPAVGYQGLRAEVTGLFKNCQYRPVQKALARGDRLGVIALPGFEGVLRREVQPGLRFLGEFRDRVRVVACLDRNPNLVSSEQLDDGPTWSEWHRVRQILGVSDDTPMLMVWGGPRDLETALGEIELRAQEALAGVPRETRQAQPDGTTRFERVLPGPDRMYPDTDLPPRPLPTRDWEALRAALPPRPWDELAALAAAGLGTELAGQLQRQGRAGSFLALRGALKGDAAALRRLAFALTAHWRSLEREGLRLPDAVGLDWLPEFLATAPRETDRAALARWARSGGRERPVPPPPLDDAALAARLASALAALPPPARPLAGESLERYRLGRLRESLGVSCAGARLRGQLAAATRGAPVPAPKGGRRR